MLLGNPYPLRAVLRVAKEVENARVRGRPKFIEFTRPKIHQILKQIQRDIMVLPLSHSLYS
jgi:hypothetical protein